MDDRNAPDRPDLSRAIEWAPPPSFDGFDVVRPLGRGGMGAVYLGHDVMLDRPIALKFIAGAHPDDKKRERFLLEARALARLQHPNVVGVYRIGQAGGRPYIAYELVDGHTLSQLPRPLPWQRALDIGLGIVRGLAAAHSRGILHRDVKPANVMVTQEGEVKLLDFGLAKLTDREDDAPPDARVMPAADSGRISSTGTLAGTPLFMAPELWRGEPATASCDLYAMGLVLYELIAGTIPFANLHGRELVQAIVQTELPPLDAVAPEIPRTLSDAIARCTRRDAGDRYRSADEVREAFEASRALYHPFSVNTADDADSGRELDVAAVVTASFNRVGTRADAMIARFYERLFELDPSLRRLFPEDMSQQRDKLYTALSLVLRNLRNPELLVPLLEDLGRRHAAYGARPEHFDLLGKSLMCALSEFDAADWTDAVEQAWAFAWSRVAQTVARGLDEARYGAEQRRHAPTRARFELPLPRPRTQYTHNGDVTLAYQVIGNGPIDLVIDPGWVSHLELAWDQPELARLLRRLASFVRVIVVDKRGTGLSDRATHQLALEDRMADLLAVMDAAGSERAALLGLSDGGASAVLIATTHPERVRALILYGGATSFEASEHTFETMRAHWGEPLFLDTHAPSVAGDDTFRRWWATYLRSAASPTTAIALLRASAAVDVRPLLPDVRAPALVMHRTGDLVVPIERAQATAAAIPGARFAELPGDDHLIYVGDGDAVVDQIHRFLLDLPTEGRIPWRVAAVLSVSPWNDGSSARLVRPHIAAKRGVEIEDGSVLFDGPRRALACARAILADARRDDIEVGLGLHVGGCHVAGGEVSGEPVEVSRELAAQAGPGELLATAVVRDLVGGDEQRFVASPVRVGAAGDMPVLAVTD